MTRPAKVQKVMDAWLDPGPHPNHHYIMQQTLFERWPVLAEALRDLCEPASPIKTREDLPEGTRIIAIDTSKNGL